MHINGVAGEVHGLAWEKGWHDENETEDHFIERTCNNLHNEVSELHEAWRNNKLHEPCDKADKMAKFGTPVLTCLEEELADIVIRAFDTAQKLGVNIEYAVSGKHQYNIYREPRHGGKRS